MTGIIKKQTAELLMKAGLTICLDRKITELNILTESVGRNVLGWVIRLPVFPVKIMESNST